EDELATTEVSSEELISGLVKAVARNGKDNKVDDFSTDSKDFDAEHLRLSSKTTFSERAKRWASSIFGTSRAEDEPASKRLRTAGGDANTDFSNRHSSGSRTRLKMKRKNAKTAAANWETVLKLWTKLCEKSFQSTRGMASSDETDSH
ncbi:unnamed protein product, partial [Amoebophrya sp. A25]